MKLGNSFCTAKINKVRTVTFGKAFIWCDNHENAEEER